MSRRHAAEKREILPDPKFGDLVLSKFINMVMEDGKKSVAERIVYGALDQVRVKQKLANDNEVIAFFKTALDKVKPQVEVKSRRVGGATYQVPCEIRADRQLALAIRWLIAYARARGENTMTDRLAAEMIEAWNDRGAAVKKREDTHKMADANKAFAHYRF
ncbi:30S ribosomal protein S7 [Micavibrio aeruginosavorus]|uniref:Small ribosomal subunit protein uS7 n=1 Tax=Micavibrio aeruginosavorus EPB TaxID=349215 RepID=M4VL73_9BACT|nr:30S ribosomal protein S7 [Micavibrio aeruginosavorus]AGH98861.1 SSU ribosomal protein S7p (S5e) [Micavibrio aeruginosavorus EPB]